MIFEITKTSNYKYKDLVEINTLDDLKKQYITSTVENPTN